MHPRLMRLPVVRFGTAHLPTCQLDIAGVRISSRTWLPATTLVIILLAKHVAVPVRLRGVPAFAATEIIGALVLAFTLSLTLLSPVAAMIVNTLRGRKVTDRGMGMPTSEEVHLLLPNVGIFLQGARDGNSPRDLGIASGRLNGFAPEGLLGLRRVINHG